MGTVTKTTKKYISKKVLNYIVEYEHVLGDRVRRATIIIHMRDGGKIEHEGHRLGIEEALKNMGKHFPQVTGWKELGLVDRPMDNTDQQTKKSQ